MIVAIRRKIKRLRKHLKEKTEGREQKIKDSIKYSLSLKLLSHFLYSVRITITYELPKFVIFTTKMIDIDPT